MGEAISIKNIYKTYRHGREHVPALQDVSLSVNEGEIFGLLGPNGAGKTTLISMLVGILKPDNGTADIFGKSCSKDTQNVQRMINVVSGFSGALHSLTVTEALTYYSMLYGIKNPSSKIESLLKQLGLSEFANWAAEDLSSGMRQRYLICKGLLNDPKLLILDEPTVGLDVESAIGVRKIIRDLRSQGRTILLTTHNMFEAEELCDRIAFISKGQIVSIGTPVELKSQIASKRALEVHCSEEQCVIDELKELKGVKATIKSPQIVHVNVDSYKRTKDVMRALADCGGEIFSVNELEPSFEETYLGFMNHNSITKGRGKTRKSDGGKSDSGDDK